MNRRFSTLLGIVLASSALSPSALADGFGFSFGYRDYDYPRYYSSCGPVAYAPAPVVYYDAPVYYSRPVYHRSYSYYPRYHSSHRVYRSYPSHRSYRVYRY